MSRAPVSSPSLPFESPPLPSVVALALAAHLLLAAGTPIAAQPGPESGSDDAASAVAAPADAPADADELFRRADALVREGRYREALQTWKEAYLERLPAYRDLEFRYPVRADIMNREKIGAYLLADLEEEYPEEAMDADAVVFEAFGFLPPGSDLEKIFIDLYSEEVAGFYDPDTKALYLIAATREEEDAAVAKKNLWDRVFGGDDRFDPLEQRSVLSHELAHALADQHFDLYSMQKSALEDDDVSLAISSLIEGEAMLVMLIDQMYDGRGSSEELLLSASASAGVFETMTSALASFAAGSSFRRAPLVLREMLIFPYTRGLGFCAAVAMAVSPTFTGDEDADVSGWRAIDRVFRRPPLSTEQILHPEKYIGPSPDVPMKITFVDAESESGPWGGEGWELADENVLGEFGVEVLLRDAIGSDASEDAAAGWDGDTYRVWKRPPTPSTTGEAAEDSAGTGDAADAAHATATTPPAADAAPPWRAVLGWVSVWDSERDAQEFADAMEELFEKGGAERLPDAKAPAAPGAGALFREEGRGLAGVWRRADGVYVVRGVPEDELAALLAWIVRFEAKPKTYTMERHEPDVTFESLTEDGSSEDATREDDATGDEADPDDEG